LLYRFNNGFFSGGRQIYRNEIFLLAKASMGWAMRDFIAFGVFLLARLVGTTLAGAQQFGPLNGKSFGSGNRVLVVLLHGDVPRGGPADYLYETASELARASGGTTAVALLRPGYYDSQGQRSAGSDHGRRDSYTARNNDLVAQSIQALKSRHRPRRVVVMGHSGGAAQLGSIIGRYPGLVDSALLVSCPCDVRRWHPNWTQSQSPIQYVRGIGRGTRIRAIT
jgi:pimeloyl-ACP methyl ester carboxylesterase